MLAQGWEIWLVALASQSSVRCCEACCQNVTVTKLFQLMQQLLKLLLSSAQLDVSLKKCNDVSKQGVDMSWTFILIVRLSTKDKRSFFNGTFQASLSLFLSILDSTGCGVTSASDFGRPQRPILHMLRSYKHIFRIPILCRIKLCCQNMYHK